MVGKCVKYNKDPEAPGACPGSKRCEGNPDFFDPESFGYISRCTSYEVKNVDSEKKDIDE